MYPIFRNLTIYLILVAPNDFENSQCRTFWLINRFRDEAWVSLQKQILPFTHCSFA